MTFWDFYGQYPVLGTIVVLVVAFLILVLLIILSSVQVTYTRGSEKPAKTEER